MKIENLTYQLLGKDYTLDVGIHRFEIDNEAHDDFYYLGKVSDLGDLSTFYGYQTIDATGLKYAIGKVYYQENLSYDSLSNLNFTKLLAKGITAIRLDSIPEGTSFSSYPMNITTSKELKEGALKPSSSATFLLKKGNEIRYVIINGFAYDVSNGEINIQNGIIR